MPPIIRLRRAVLIASLLLAVCAPAQPAPGPKTKNYEHWCGFDNVYEFPTPVAAINFMKKFKDEFFAVRDGNLVFVTRSNVVKASNFSTRRSLQDEPCGLVGPYMSACRSLDTELSPVPEPVFSDDSLPMNSNKAIWERIGITKPLADIEFTRRAKVAVLDTGIFEHTEFDRAPEQLPLSLSWYSLDPASPDTGCNGGHCCREVAPETVDTSHGTHVAGLIAAGDDNYGISGLGNARELMSISTLDRTHKCFSRRRLTAAYKCAVEQGAEIINISMQSNMFKEFPSDFAELVRKRTLLPASSAPLIVVAAGNDSCDFGRTNCGVWPAGINLSTIVTVEALELSGARVATSNHGKGVDLAAPAPASGLRFCTTDAQNSVGALAANCKNGYLPFGATSAATAIVTGAATRVWGHPNFDRCDAAELRRILRGYGTVIQRTATQPRDTPSCQLNLEFLYNNVRRDEHDKALDLCRCLPAYDKDTDASECGVFREKPLCG